MKTGSTHGSQDNDRVRFVQPIRREEEKEGSGGEVLAVNLKTAAAAPQTMAALFNHPHLCQQPVRATSSATKRSMSTTFQVVQVVQKPMIVSPRNRERKEKRGGKEPFR